MLQTLGINYHARAIVVSIVVFVHVFLLLRLSACHSPVSDELGHFAAGLSHWTFQRFDMYAVNPPGARLVATLPTYCLGFNEDWSNYSTKVEHRSEFSSGISIVKQNPETFSRLFMYARWTYVPISLLGAFVCFRWAKVLFGVNAGYIALILWCVSPTVLAYGATITPDLPAAVFGVVACYLFRSWIWKLSWSSAIFFGFVLGLCELTKFTWLILYFIVPILSFLHWMPYFGRKVSWKLITGQLSVAFAVSLYVINLGYGFDRTLKPLRTFDFYSSGLGGAPAAADNTTGNRFRGTWLGKVPVPLPANMLIGIDYQKDEFERGYWSYLRGEHKHGGWWYYYLYAMLIKAPIGTILLCCVALFSLVRWASRRQWFLELLTLMVPPVAIIGFVSSHTGFNHHLRYVLPAFPFLFVFASCATTVTWRGLAFLRFMPNILITSSIVSTLFAFPHLMSYFNESIGGPRNGWKHLDFSNIDWGQDIYLLKNWADDHPESLPLHVSTKNYVPLEVYKIEGTQQASYVVDGNRKYYPAGWYAMGIHMMLTHESPDAAFLKLKPADSIGYSMYVYHLSEPLYVPSTNNERIR
jgi:4-amino-4-deoxy-L-arabinose transferase-like glycosyltransferase